ncbi:unnamed protein product [Leptidea sinapis]|uniref:Ubiquitin-like domain-containing protein n=1 Tax=Leptidea sinapis TaxID=189913 RepID=A0A5E4QAI9_9NEOP|nr:unnamed protein product [Leptidea sinapis]
MEMLKYLVNLNILDKIDIIFDFINTVKRNHNIISTCFIKSYDYCVIGMETLDQTISSLFLGIKVKPGPIERFKIENYTLNHTVSNLKSEAEKKTELPSASLELIYHGKILNDDETLQDSGIKNGEMIHVVKKKAQNPTPPPPTFTDAALAGLNYH